MKISKYAVLSLLVTACSTSAPPPAAGPEPPTMPSTADAVSDNDGSTEGAAEAPIIPGQMTVAQARQVVATVEAAWPLAENHPLLHPQSLADIEAILKLDQVRLFPAGIEYVATLDSKDALALRGQIELAWGESYIVMIDIMSNLKKVFARELTKLEKKERANKLSNSELAELYSIRSMVAQLDQNREAFKLMAIEHMTNGQEISETVIERFPDNFIGYRLAADFHRTLKEWDAFDAMITKIEATNPASNGLLFLKGAAAFQRNKDLTTAAGFYRKALKHDPKFVRAQAHLVMIQQDVGEMYEEFVKLEQLNPHHQIIQWAGESVKKAYRKWRKQQAVFGGAG